MSTNGTKTFELSEDGVEPCVKCVCCSTWTTCKFGWCQNCHGDMRKVDGMLWDRDERIKTLEAELAALRTPSASPPAAPPHDPDLSESIANLKKEYERQLDYDNQVVQNRPFFQAKDIARAIQSMEREAALQSELRTPPAAAPSPRDGEAEDDSLLSVCKDVLHELNDTYFDPEDMAPEWKRLRVRLMALIPVAEPAAPSAEPRGEVGDDRLARVEVNAQYWITAAHRSVLRDDALHSYEQAVNHWKNAAYGLRDELRRPDQAARQVGAPIEDRDKDYHTSGNAVSAVQDAEYEYGERLYRVALHIAKQRGSVHPTNGRAYVAKQDIDAALAALQGQEGTEGRNG